jgi:hypothetical protein
MCAGDLCQLILESNRETPMSDRQSILCSNRVPLPGGKFSASAKLGITINAGSGRLLPRNPQYVPEAVLMKAAHGRKVVGESFGVSGLQLFLREDFLLSRMRSEIVKADELLLSARTSVAKSRFALAGWRLNERIGDLSLTENHY